MDLIALASAKNYANKVTAGFKNVEISGMSLIFTLLDDSKATITLPAPENGKDGVSVLNLSIDTDGSLLCHMSDGTIIDAGHVPMVDVKLDDYYTKEETNAINGNMYTVSYSHPADATRSINDTKNSYVFDFVTNQLQPAIEKYGKENIILVVRDEKSNTAKFDGVYLWNTRNKRFQRTVQDSVTVIKTKGYSAVQQSWIYLTIYENDAYFNSLSNEVVKFLDTDWEYTSLYQPKYAGSPATKQYVDDAITTAITSALEGEY